MLYCTSIELISVGKLQRAQLVPFFGSIYFAIVFVYSITYFQKVHFLQSLLYILLLKYFHLFFCFIAVLRLLQKREIGFIIHFFSNSTLKLKIQRRKSYIPYLMELKFCIIRICLKVTSPFLSDFLFFCSLSEI